MRSLLFVVAMLVVGLAPLAGCPSTDACTKNSDCGAGEGCVVDDEHPAGVCVATFVDAGTDGDGAGDAGFDGGSEPGPDAGNAVDAGPPEPLRGGVVVGAGTVRGGGKVLSGRVLGPSQAPPLRGQRFTFVPSGQQAQ